MKKLPTSYIVDKRKDIVHFSLRIGLFPFWNYYCLCKYAVEDGSN